MAIIGLSNIIGSGKQSPSSNKSSNTIESILVRKLNIRFIDARELVTEAKLNLEIIGYPTKEQRTLIEQEAISIFQNQRSSDQKELLRQSSSDLQALKDFFLEESLHNDSCSVTNSPTKSNSTRSTSSMSSSRSFTSLSLLMGVGSGSERGSERGSEKGDGSVELGLDGAGSLTSTNSNSCNSLFSFFSSPNSRKGKNKDISSTTTNNNNNNSNGNSHHRRRSALEMQMRAKLIRDDFPILDDDDEVEAF